MKLDLNVIYNGKEVDIDFSECEDIHDCLDVLVETLGREIDSEFNGYYQVNQIPYWYKHIACNTYFTSASLYCRAIDWRKNEKT